MAIYRVTPTEFPPVVVEAKNEASARNKACKLIKTMSGRAPVFMAVNSLDSSCMEDVELAFVQGAFSIAHQLALPLADNGDVRAQAMLAGLYGDGLGVARDLVSAFEWCQKAAMQGDSTAQTNLARMYTFGDGVEQNYTQAKSLLELAASKGNPVAEYQLGRMYLEGIGVERDAQTGLVWLIRATDLGYVDAQFKVAEIYYEGTGVTKDLLMAAHYLYLPTYP